MKRTSLNSHALEKLMKNLFQALQKESFEETLSPSLITAHQLMPLTDALYNIHFPQNPELLRKAQYRLKFEELFYVQLNILRYTKNVAINSVDWYLNGWVKFSIPFMHITCLSS